MKFKFVLAALLIVSTADQAVADERLSKQAVYEEALDLHEHYLFVAETVRNRGANTKGQDHLKLLYQSASALIGRVSQFQRLRAKDMAIGATQEPAAGSGLNYFAVCASAASNLAEYYLAVTGRLTMNWGIDPALLSAYREDDLKCRAALDLD